MKERWVAIVYDYGEKIASHSFTGEEAEAESEAAEWVKVYFGEGKDWSLHRMRSE